MTAPTLLSYALAYAKHGWRVFPLHTISNSDCTCGRDSCSSPGKHPRIKDWLVEATTDPGPIRAWWEHWPTTNIGIATGNGLYVIDVDLAKGAELEGLKQIDEDILDSRAARTGSGGMHYYLSCDQSLPNTAGKLGNCIDTRGDGGYVVAPPSYNRYGQYTWITPSARLVPVSPNLLAVLQDGRTNNHSFFLPHMYKKEEGTYDQPEIVLQQKTLQTGTSSGTTSSSETASDSQEGKQPQISREARNDYLVRVAGKLAKTRLAFADIRELVLLLNQQRYGQGKHPNGPLTEEEIEHTVFKSLAKWAAVARTEPHAASITTLSDLMTREVHAPVWIIEGLLVEGLTLLAGKPKIGKSWFILNLALGLAAGRSVLGKNLDRPYGVLYLCLEDSEFRLKKRVSKLLNGESEPTGFYFQINWEPLASGGLDELRIWLASHPDVKVVIVDTLARVRMASKSTGNVYQDDYDLLGSVQKMALECGIAFVMVHHMRKTESTDVFDNFSGSTGLNGAADTSIALERERNQPEGTLSITGRDVEECELAVRFNAENGTWTLTGTAAERQQSQSRQAVIEVLKTASEPMSPKEVARDLEKPEASIRSLLKRMASEGLIAKVGYGKYMLPATSVQLVEGQHGTCPENCEEMEVEEPENEGLAS